jgi:transcription elongation factor Elf1
MFCSLNNSLFTPETRTKSNFCEQHSLRIKVSDSQLSRLKNASSSHYFRTGLSLTIYIKSSYGCNPQSPTFFTIIAILPQSTTTAVGRAATPNMLYNSPYSSTTMGDPFSTPDPSPVPRTPLQSSRPSNHPPENQLPPSPGPKMTMSSPPGTFSTTYSAVNTFEASFRAPLPSSGTPRTPLSASASPSPFRFGNPISPPPTCSSSRICTLCDPPRTLATNGTLQRHINTIHLHRSFKCTRCNRVCSSQSALDRHIRDNLCSSVKCSICRTGNLFKNQTALEKHMMTGHLEEYQAAMGLVNMSRSAEKVTMCHPEPEVRDTESEYEDDDMELYGA